MIQSERLLLRMRREGYLKHDGQIRGVWRDTLLYAILSDEWATPLGSDPPRKVESNGSR